MGHRTHSSKSSSTRKNQKFRQTAADLRKAHHSVTQHNARERRGIPKAVAKAVASDCPTGKRQFADRSAAERALKVIAVQREQDLRETGTTNRHETRHYRCHLCPWLHLTSQDVLQRGVEVDSEMWQAALAQAARERAEVLCASPVANDDEFDVFLAETSLSNNQDDWTVAA